MADTSLVLTPLTRASMEERLSDALALEAASGLPCWNVEHLLADLPGKWEHSRWISRPDTPSIPIGYAVLSRKSDENIHLHRFIVSPPGQGFGSIALRQLFIELRMHAPYMTVKTLADAEAARRFYRRHGFAVLFHSPENAVMVKPLRPENSLS